MTVVYENWARSLLADPDLGPEPTSTVDFGRAVSDGRRRERAQRIAATIVVAGGTALAVAAVPVALATRDGGPGGHVLAPAVVASAMSTTPIAADRAPIPPSAPTRCTREPLALPAGATEASVLSEDPSGRYTVGIAHRDPMEQREGAQDYVIAPNAGNQLVLWDNGRPTVLDPPQPGLLKGLDVNVTGAVTVAVIANHETADARAVNWVYRDGTFTGLSTPGRWYSALGINSRGDVVAAWLDHKGVHPPLVWPAAAPDRPRELTGGDPGDEVVVFVGGIDDDGTVVGTAAFSWAGTSPPPPIDTARARPLYWSPDGAVHDLPTPAGFGSVGSVFQIRGGIAVGDVERSDPNADRRGNRAAIWNLRTGSVSVDDRLASAADGNAYGWLVGRTADGPPGRTVAVLGGGLVPLPMPGPPTSDDGGALTISDDGRILTGAVLTDRGILPVRWICS